MRRLVSGGVGAGALTVATTHHSILAGLKFEDPRFENASVEFDEVALAPTYKLLWGIPGRSHALNIASRCVGAGGAGGHPVRQLLQLSRPALPSGSRSEP